MSNRVCILPNLRKGFSRRIAGNYTDKSGLRAGFDVDVKILGHTAGTIHGGDVNIGGKDNPSLTRQFSLAGPVDVRSISADAIAQAIPADKSSGYSCDYMPFLEFHEEDFPWRYTPLPSSDKLVPWLLLLACKEGEYTLLTAPDGSHQVAINLEGAEGEEADTFYPKKEDFHKLAHVQILTPDEEDPIAHVSAHPEDGVSRLFCSRKLSSDTKYTVFLVPAFELGRLAGLGEPFQGKAYLDRLSFEGNPVSRTFPVYYQWSFTTGSLKFMELARKQQFVSEAEFGTLSSGLKLDIRETGLKAYRLLDPPVYTGEPIDLPVALVKPGFSESTLKSEDPRLDEELKDDILLKNPVFSDAGTEFSVNEDPWIVPPVYGARHILAKSFDLKQSAPFLKDLNLKFRNRAAAGMGANVVKKNQEFFMNRAWGVVEEINKMNQRIREFYLVLKNNGAADAKTTALREYKFGSSVFGLQADAAIRVAASQSASEINPVDLAMDVTGQSLNVLHSSMGEYTRGDGITAEELEVISQESNWRGRREEITKMGVWYKRITGKKPFFDSIDPKFRFIGSITAADITYPTVVFNQSGDVTVRPAGRHLFTLRQWLFYPVFQPQSFVPYLGFNNSPAVLRWVDNTDALVYDKNTHVMDLLSLYATLKNSQTEYERRWAEDADSHVFDMVTLPVSVVVLDSPDINPDNCKKIIKKESCVNWNKRIYYLRQAVYDRSFPEYPAGVAFELETDDDVVINYILPQSSFYDSAKNKYFYMYQTDKGGVDVMMLAQSQGDKDWFFSAKSDKISPWMQLNGGVRVKQNKDLIYGKNRKLLSELTAWPSNLEGVAGLSFVGGWDGYVATIKENSEFYYKLHCAESVPLMWISRYKTKDKKEDRSIVVGIDYNICWLEKDGAKVNWTKLHNLIMDTYLLLEKSSRWLWRPNLVCMKDYPKNVHVFDAEEMMGVKDVAQAKQLIESTYRDFIGQVDKYRVSEYLKDVWETMGKRDDMTAEKKCEDEMKKVDADAVNRTRLVEVAKEFSKRGMTLDLMESNFDGKYPIMAAPVFPDPTSFYLRELSERYLLPSVDELKMDSISISQTNPVFEEAFLAGMNTEMGRELLWREYPTDERGSYFRKFWDQDTLPADFGKGYFDVKYLHKWDKQLGENHEPGKGRMLVFVVKSELMVQYPQTSLFLATVGPDPANPNHSCPKDILHPEMTGWLSDNTFMAGFYPDKLAAKDGVYLMFQEADKSQRFKYSTQATDRLSSDFAVNRSDSGSLWAIEVDPACLTIK